MNKLTILILKISSKIYKAKFNNKVILNLIYQIN